MTREDAASIAAWATRAGIEGLDEEALVTGFCERARMAGVPLGRANAIIDTLHPSLEGRVFSWLRDEATPRPPSEYARIDPDSEAGAFWRQSPFFHLEESGHDELRRRLTPEADLDFPIVEDLRAQGFTDYLAQIHRFAPGGGFGELSCIYASWAAVGPDGFSAADLALLRAATPSLALALKAASLERIARTLAETYLGRDAGRRVLAGEIERGVAEKIPAVIWLSDLHGFTRISENAPPREIIPFLNAYAEAVIEPVRAAGGEVLKLIGDGVLAIFRADPAYAACAAALSAEAAVRARVEALNVERAAAGLPVSAPYVGLHLGEVFYGNIGSVDRLDFTVVGPAVNQASRICAACREAGRDLLVSEAVQAAAPAQERERLVSVGAYALRGVEASQTLFARR